MSIKNPSTKLILDLLILVLVGLGAYFYLQSTHKVTDKGNDPTSEANQRALRAQQSSKKGGSGSNTDPKTSSNTSTDPNTPLITGVIRDASGNVVIHGKVPGVTTGTCVYKISSNSGTTIDKNVPVTLRVNDYICESLSVPAKEMPTGEWTITATYNNDNGGVSQQTQRTLTL